MINEDYCSYEVAKLLREKGFDEKTLSYYEDNVLCRGDWFEWNRSPLGHIAAPTHQMAMKWLREEKHFYMEIRRSANTYLYGAILIKDGAIDFSRISNIYKTHEEAVEAALKYCLENLI